MNTSAGNYPTPGSYSIANEEYHKLPHVGKSDLDRVRRSVGHYLAERENPTPPTPALLLGQAVHCAILEPLQFTELFIVAPTLDKRTSGGKSAWQDFLDSSGGKQVLTPDQWELVHRVQEAVLSHPVAGGLFVGGVAEESLLWRDEETGILMKARPDYRKLSNGLLLDLKTTSNASWPAFGDSVTRYRYHVQGAVYLDGVKAVHGQDSDQFLLVAAEKEPPYSVACYLLSGFSIDRGRKKYRRDLRKLKTYLDSEDKWAGYPLEIQEVDPPEWEED